MKQIITSPNAPAALGPYSHAVQVGNFLFTSGQVPLVPETGKLAGESIEAQANQVLNNLEQVLKSAGLTFADVVKTTIFLTDLYPFPRRSPRTVLRAGGKAAGRSEDGDGADCK